MNVKGAYYVPSLPSSVVIVLQDDTVWGADSAPFRILSEADLSRLPGYEAPALREGLLKSDYEIFPFNYFQYGLEKYGVEMVDLLRLSEYAARIGREPATIRQKILRGSFPYAVKMGRDWFIPAAAPYNDSRIKTGEYKNWRKTKESPAE